MFANTLGFAPAGDIFELAKLDPILLQKSQMVRIDIDMLSPILEALVEQIAYNSGLSASNERNLTVAAARWSETFCLGEPLHGKC